MRSPVRVQAPPGGWEDATVAPSHDDGDFIGAIWDSNTLNENLNSEQEALERAYDLLVKRGESLGMQGLYNPYREDQSGEQRAAFGSAGRFVWRPDQGSLEGTPFAYESEGVRWKALEFEEQWKREVHRLGDRADAEGGVFDARIDEGSRKAVALLSTTLRKDAQERLEAIKQARGSGFWSVDTLTEFGVGMGASMNDPAQIATLGVGAPEALFGKSILAAGAKEAAVNASVELMLQPGVQASKLEAGVIDNWQQAVGDGLTNVGMAGALGFAFGAGGKLIDNKLFAPGRERTEAFRSLAKDIEAVRFDDAAVQRGVMKMIGDVVEAEGPIQPSQSMADALREAAARAPDPAAAARLGAVATEIERALQPQEDPDVKFDRAREAMGTLSRMTEESDPESAALVRKALYEAERDYATARQRPDTVPMDEFADAIEAADAQVRALEQFTSRPEAPLPEPRERLLDTSDDAPSPDIGAKLEENGKRVTFTQFDPMQLGVAPDEMQYKRFSGAQGVNGAISDIETWHAPSSGKVLVFERLDGSRVVVDGHQRRERAQTIAQRDGRDDIRLDGYLYKEADGWTVQEMRLKGAQKNIREGRSDVLDTAQALRESPDAIDASFPVSRSNIRQARKLARLSPEAWDLTRAGVLEPQYAELIAAVAPDRPAMHAPLARTLVEAAPDNVRQAENILSEALLDYAERNVAEQPMLFADDGLGRAVMYRERAQIMDAAYGALRSDRSVFKALVDNGDIARAIGNELVDQANLTAKDQVDLAIAAIMHARRSGTRTAVTDMITRALDSVRREGVTPSRAGQQVAREIRTLVEAKGFRALLEAEGPRPPEPAEAGPLFDDAGSPAHVAQADMLENMLRPEGRAAPDVKLAKEIEAPDPVTSLVEELKAGGNGEGRRSPDAILAEIRDLVRPAVRAGDPKSATLSEVHASIQAEMKRLEQAETQLRETLVGLTDGQKVLMMRTQYPDSYAALNRLEGAALDDAIVGRVLAGELKFGRRGAPGSDVTYKTFSNAALTPTQNKIAEMALNNFTNLEIATEMGISLAGVSSELSRARRVLKPLGVEIPKGITGKTIDGQRPGALQEAIYKLADQDLESAQIHERLAAEGMETTVRTVYTYYSRWRAAKRDGQKFAISAPVLPPEIPRFPKAGYEARDFVLMFNDGIDYARMAVELSLATGKAVPVDTVRVVSTRVRTALRELRGDPVRFADAAAAMHVSIAELEEFIDNIGGTRTPTLRGEAKRLMESGLTDTADIAAGMRKYAAEHRLDFKEASLPQTISQVRRELNLSASKQNTVTTPEMRAQIIELRKAGWYPDQIQRKTGAPFSGIRSTIHNERMRGTEFPRLQSGASSRFAVGYGGVPIKIPAFDGAAKLRELLGEPSTYLPWRHNQRFQALAASAGETIGEAPVADIVPGQSQIRHNFKEVKQRYGGSDADLPQLVREGGKYYIRDGTHRIADKVSDGETTIRARIIDLDAVGLNPAGATREEIIDRVKAEFGDGAMALVRSSDLNVADRPPAWADPLTMGITDANGRVTLFAINVKPDDVRGVVLHEIGVHAGLQAMLGQDGFSKLLQQIESRFDAEDPAIRAAYNRVPADTPYEHVTEEILAYLVQYAPKSSIVQRLLADIRAWLYRTFPKVQEWMTLTENDLVSLALGAVRQRVRDADWSTPIAHTKNGASFIEPIRPARQDAFGMPRFSGGYEPRDLILMFNDALPDARILAELGLASGRTVNSETLGSQMSRVRAVLRTLREDPERYAAAAKAMAVDTREFDAFIDNINAPRHPTLKGEAVRLVAEGATDTKRIMAGLRVFAEQNRIPFKESSLTVLVSQARAENGKSASRANTVTTPEQRRVVHERRMAGESIIDIANSMKLPYDNVSQVITNARAEGVVYPPTPRRQPGVSTGPVKYARRPDVDRNREATTPRNTGASAGEPGQPAGDGNARAGATAAGGGSRVGSVQPVRALASEPLPPTVFVAGEWNERIALSPEQRAERREQFREFVDSSIVEHDASKFPTTWAFKNGKRYEGAMRVVETRRYRIRQTEDMHPEWREILEPEETGLTAEIHGKEATIHDSNVAFELRSTGIGRKIYMQAIDDMLALGLVVNSDVSVSENAIALWKSLRKQGYDVVQRVPDALLELGDDGQYAHPSSSVAVFYVAGKKPRAPELPASERDVMTQINEERDLTEHLPTCLKGKRNG